MTAVIFAPLAVALLAGCSEGESSSAPTTSISHLSMAFEVDHQPTLAGFSDRVFVGQVVKKTGSKELSDGVPAGQWEINVIETLKGPQLATQVVSQEGGAESKDSVILMDGDPIIKPGQTYLFAGRLNAGTGSVQVVPRYGDIPLDTSSAQISTRAQSSAHPAVAKMKESIRTQVVVPRTP